MVTKILKISDLLILKLQASEYVFRSIDSCFPNVLETKENYEYEIVYNEVDEILDIYKNFPGKIVSPFRNSQYLVNKKNEVVVAYAKKQEFSDENAIIKDNNTINIFAKNDESNKNLVRLIIELIVRKLLEKKYYPLHASCVVNENSAIIYFGKKGSGKSTALFSSVLLANSFPLANDITFVGKENGIWKAFGTSYDLTFDKSLFSQIHENKIPFSDYNFKPQYHSDKIRYSANEFCQSFNTNWIWSAPIESINVVNLNPNNEFKIYSQISRQKALEYLIEYGRDHNFTFDDLLMINDLQPNFDYESLIQSVVFNEVEGNILKYQTKSETYIRS
jgi:hypothetical protein